MTNTPLIFACVASVIACIGATYIADMIAPITEKSLPPVEPQVIPVPPPEPIVAPVLVETAPPQPSTVPTATVQTPMKGGGMFDWMFGGGDSSDDDDSVSSSENEGSDNGEQLVVDSVLCANSERT